jgi:hypothetical protein
MVIRFEKYEQSALRNMNNLLHEIWIIYMVNCFEKYKQPAFRDMNNQQSASRNMNYLHRIISVIRFEKYEQSSLGNMNNLLQEIWIIYME